MLNSPIMLVLCFSFKSLSLCVFVEYLSLTAYNSVCIFASQLHDKSVSLIMLCDIKSLLCVTSRATSASFGRFFLVYLFPVPWPQSVCVGMCSLQHMRPLLSIATHAPGFHFSLFLPFQWSDVFKSLFNFCSGGYAWYSYHFL